MMFFNFFEIFKEKYEDIQILGVNKEHTKLNQHKTCTVFLELSQRPPRRWLDLFAMKQVSPFHPVRARIERDYMIVTCQYRDYEKNLMSLLQKDIEECNFEYRKLENPDKDNILQK
jgi:hypothetical protein